MVLLDQQGQTEGQLHALSAVEPGIAIGSVVEMQVLMVEVLGAAYALGDILPRQFEMNSRQEAACRLPS